MATFTCFINTIINSDLFDFYKTAKIQKNDFKIFNLLDASNKKNENINVTIEEEIYTKEEINSKIRRRSYNMAENKEEVENQPKKINLQPIRVGVHIIWKTLSRYHQAAETSFTMLKWFVPKKDLKNIFIKICKIYFNKPRNVVIAVIEH